MLRLSLSLRDLASLRFALSPVWELVASVRVLKDPDAHVANLPWVSRVRRLLPDGALEWDLLWELVPVPTRFLPGFLAPTPRSPLHAIEEELASLTEVPADVVRADLATVFEDEMPPAVADLYRDPSGHLPRLAAQMEAYWRIAVAPDWPRIRGLLEGDVMYRALRLADGGADLLFSDLHPLTRWHEGELVVDQEVTSAAHVLEGRGLVLVPSVFAWPRAFVKAVKPWPPVLRYPARGVARLWHPDRKPGDRGLTEVLGRSRVLLLSELDDPASTTELGRRTGLAPASVSTHLAKLRAAGLVTSHRAGRVVLYARTERADALLTPQSDGPDAPMPPP